MKKIIIQMLYSLVSKLLNKKVINAIREYIVRYSTAEIDGYLKKLKVTDEVGIAVKQELEGVETYLLSMAIDIIYGFLKVNKEI